MNNAFLDGGVKLSGFPPVKKRTVPRGGWWCAGLMLGWLCFPGWAWGGPSSHVHTPESLVSPPASPQAVSPPESAAETLWLPLREVIQQYSESTGKRVRLSERLQTEDKLFDQVYSANDPSWLEDFSRIEIFYDESGKREIILLKSHSLQPSARPSLITRTPRKQSRTKTSPTLVPQKGPHSENGASAWKGLSREKLQKLMIGAQWIPLPANLYEDPEYREFFEKYGVTAPKDLRDRRYAKKIRKAARRLFNSMRTN